MELGWYSDPARRHALRFFDGVFWTDHVADGGERSLDPWNPTMASPSPNDESFADRQTSSVKRTASHRASDDPSTVETMLRRSRQDESSFGSLRGGGTHNPTAPGWYPDPSRSHQLRYFDGQGWTEYVADGDVYRVDPV